MLFAGGAIALAACSGGGSHSNATDSGISEDGSSSDDAGGSVSADDASADSSENAIDGVPTRNACTSSFGAALSMFYGRLDGLLVSIVPAGQHGCNGDSTHVHLQILMNNAVYDVAVNTDGLEAEVDHAMVGAAWSEGWNASAMIDYPTTLGVHSTGFATTNAAALVTRLSAVNHITVYATAYGPGGVHLVHRDLNNHDGALVLDPLGPTPHWLVFRFANDTF